jgi:hypothetical protein
MKVICLLIASLLLVEVANAQSPGGPPPRPGTMPARNFPASGPAGMRGVPNQDNRAEATKFFADNCPKWSAMLESLKKTNPSRYNTTVMRLTARYEQVRSLKAQSEKLYDNAVQQLRVIDELLSQTGDYRTATGDAKKAALRKSIRAKMEELSQLRLEEGRLMIERLERTLKEARERQEKDEKEADKIVDQMSERVLKGDVSWLSPLGPRRLRPDSDAREPGREGRPERDGMFSGEMLDRYHKTVSELNLTDDQKKKIDAIFTTAGERRKAADTQPASPERTAAQSNMLQKLMKDVNDVLTEEQRKAMMDKFRDGAGRPPMRREDDGPRRDEDRPRRPDGPGTRPRGDGPPDGPPIP